jgi:hypothetical protein
MFSNSLLNACRMVCDEDGMVYNIWFRPESYHEVRSLRLRHKMSKRFRFLTENFEFIGDKGYKINFKPSNPPTFKETAFILVGTS